MKGISGVTSTTEFFRAKTYPLIVYVEKIALLPVPGKKLPP